MVGTSLSCGLRSLPVTASARMRPERRCGSAAARPGNIAWVWPPSRSLMAGAMPRYGMCSMKAPVSCLNNSIVRCVSDPGPAEP